MPVTMREVTVAGISVPPDGIPATGVILFVMPSALYDDTGNMILGRGYYSLALVAGAGSVQVPVNDDTGVTPQGWQYRALIRTEDDWKEDGLIEVPSGASALEFVPNFVPSSAEPSSGVTYATLAALQAETAAREAADLVVAADAAAALAVETAARIAGDATVASNAATALATHEADTTNVHGIVNTADLLTTASLGSVTPQTSFGAASSDGVATSISRSDHTHGTPTHGAAAHSAVSLSDLSAPTGDLSIGTHKLTNVTNGSAATDAATFGQIIPATIVDAKGDVIAATAADTVARLAVGTAGQVLVPDPVTSTGLVWRAQDPDAYTSGMCWPTRAIVNTAGALTSQGLRLVFFTAVRAETWATIATSVGGTAAGATPTLCRMGIYSVAGNGDLSLVASHANDTALWNTPSARAPKTLTTPLAATAGQRYAIGALIVTAATLPVLACADPILPASMLSTAPRLCGLVTGQTDLPNSVSAASIADSGFIIYGEVLP